MAGLGFKDFQVGEVLTSADVDGYLMQQTVMRFADAGARGSALGTAPGTAVALAEGMVVYLDDMNALQVYDGSGWTTPVAGIGSNVLQVVKTDTFTTTSTSYVDITGLEVTITPTTNTAKILVVAQVAGASTDSTGGSIGAIRLMRDATAISVAAAAGSRTVATGIISTRSTGSDLIGFTVTSVHIDSPATTSAITYGVEARVGAGTLYINRTESDADNSNNPRFVSSIMAVEVAA